MSASEAERGGFFLGSSGFFLEARSFFPERRAFFLERRGFFLGSSGFFLEGRASEARPSGKKGGFRGSEARSSPSEGARRASEVESRRSGFVRCPVVVRGVAGFAHETLAEDVERGVEPG